MYTTEKMERLPKWAQERIKLLEQSVTHWREKALGVETAATGIHYWTGGDPVKNQRYLPEGSIVTFSLARINPKFKPMEIHVHAKDDTLYVRADSPISMQANASNCVDVQERP